MRTIEEYITLKEQEADKLRGEMKDLSVLIDAFSRAVSEDRKESRIAAEAEAKKNAMPWSAQELSSLLPKDVINYAISLNKTPVNVFADNCGVNISTLAKWRNGECIPRGVTAQPAIVAIKAEINKPWAEKVFVTALANYERRIGRRKRLQHNAGKDMAAGMQSRQCLCVPLFP